MDRYKPLNVLGSGGNAEVILCRDQILGRELAVKRLKEECPIDSPTERRFLREARIMAALPHPAIPIVYDLGRDNEGRPFFVTDVLKDGIYLVNVLSGLRRGVMEIEYEYPLERLIRIMMLVCGAIEDAHKRGVIHRDIKPEHIFITGRNRVILLDWGLARLANEKWEPKGPEADHVSSNSDLQANRLTVQGQLPGTPLYMSPEQVSDSPDLDHRTDIYSIGAVLYDCLVLDTLVSGRTVGEVFDCIMKGEVAKPTDVSKRRDLTAELERVCLKAVAKDPRDRYQTAGQLGEALRECQLTLLANFERDLDRSVPRFNFGAPAGSNNTPKPPAKPTTNDSLSTSETNKRRRSLEAGICQEMLVGNRPNIDLSEAIVPFGRKPKLGRKKRPGNGR
jgi:eukaryotic-like serine/threonine-protein kinase